MRALLTPGAALMLLVGAGTSNAAWFSIETSADIKETSSLLAYDLMSYYHGNETGKTPGILPGPPPAGPYYWWEAGAMWGTMIDYWFLTGDSTYNQVVSDAIQFQTGQHSDFMPKNVTASLGNDDQGFWGMTAMLAAEEKFPDPASDQPGWLALAQGVFNTMAAPDRHDETCGGGIRWQIPKFNTGYDYKNSIANGCFFNIAARLARYTGNQTYADWANIQWDWMEEVGFMWPTGEIWDGAHVPDCKDLTEVEFSYNNAVWVQGAAYMWNHTEDSKWMERTKLYSKYGIDRFFPEGIMVEPGCELSNTCTTDMLTFKGYFHRWYATVTQVAPYTAEYILPVLKTSATAAINQCTGPPTGRACGFNWDEGEYADPPGTGVGQQMNVLAAVTSLLIKEANAPVTDDTGGTSEGNPNAGSDSQSDFQAHWEPVTTGERAGAAIITAVILGSVCGMFGWMSLGA